MLASRQEIVEVLQEQVRQIETERRPADNVNSSGCKGIDRLLPGQGFRRGSLIEWIGHKGSGASTLALIAAKEACREGGALVVVDCERVFYPPAAAGLINLTNAIVVCPRNQRDHTWALHQALSCSGVAAVLCWPNALNDRTFRRLQLAAEKGGSLGFLMRPTEIIGSPSWSDMQLLVQALPTIGNRRMRVEVLRCRGGNSGRSVELEFNDETNTMYLASELANSTTSQRSPGA
jgi:protein ImuA